MIEVFDCEQGTEEWFNCRLGIPTASMFKDMMAKGQGKTRKTYLYKLAGEAITGAPAESFSNTHTERGNELESTAVALYVAQTESNVETCGFIKREIGPGIFAGYSPDGLVGDSGLIEVKTKLPHLQIDLLLSGKIPSEHMKQIQGGLYISGREWCDFISYWPGLPLFIKRCHRDESEIQDIKNGIITFSEELKDVINQISGM